MNPGPAISTATTTAAVLAPVILEALRKHDGEATLQELEEFVIGAFSLRTASVEHLHSGKGRRTELDYRLAWARTRLRTEGKICRVARGIWALTEAGR